MPFSQGHTLLVGVGTHAQHPRLDVPIAISDAQAVRQALEDPRTCGYPPGQVQVLAGSAADRAGILAGLDALAAAAGPEQTALVYFCGHGALGTDGDYYLAAHDMHVEGSRIVAGSGIREGELLQKLAAIPARRVLMLFNACYSGNLSPALDLDAPALETSNPPVDAATALLGTGQGRIMIAACREEQVSYIGDADTSIFTAALIAGLRGRGVQNRGGYVSAFDLYEAIYESVTETVNRMYHLAQEPELTVLKGVGPFAVALYRGATTLGEFDDRAALPEAAAVREVLPAHASRSYERRVIRSHGGVTVGGDLNAANVAGRDNIDVQTGDIGAGSQVAIGSNIRQRRGKTG